MKPAAVNLISAILALGASCVAFTGCSLPSSGKTEFETVAPKRAGIEQYVTASGTLSAVVSVDVGSQVSGKIAGLAVDFNAPVKKGQLVAEIDPTVYDAALRRAEGELAGARANVTLKQQNLERMKSLVPVKAASQLDMDQAIAELAQAQASVIVSQAALESAQANLAYCKITAPVDGIVISRKVDVGQTVIAAMTTPVLFTIAQDLSKMHISASISEADIGQVKLGQAVQFTVDAFAEESFKGLVSQVRMSPATTQNVVTYETIISVDNPEHKLFPGMTADVSILVAQTTNALTIPNAALRYSPPEGVEFEEAPPKQNTGNQRLVYALGANPSVLKPLLVTAGITDGVNTEILDGLTGSEAVVISTLSFSAESREFFPPPPPRTPE